MDSIYWYDYETFGINPRTDRLAQFAGIRTDHDLNVISDPLDIYCRITDDYLPHPAASLVTGITPQLTLEKGIPEPEFIATIQQEFARPHTCVAGYNNIRFDDEFTRYALYRNFYDPYAREWQNGNSRWDIIDMVRLTRALRPEGIQWPVDADGTPSNRLELLTEANGISHEAAHDAMSDVYATIAMARLIREKQPRLYHYLFKLRNKNEVAQLLNPVMKTPVVHTSGMYPNTVCNTALVAPLAQHPINKNGVIVYDLRYDPTPLLESDSDTIAAKLYTATEDLTEGEQRIPLKTVHINKCPVVVPMNTLDPASTERLGIDIEEHQQHLEMLKHAPDLEAKLRQVFSERNFENSPDPEQNLYGGFISNADRERMQHIHSMRADELKDAQFNFEDERLPELLFRYKARFFPEALNQEDAQAWQDYRKQRLTDASLGYLTFEGFAAELMDARQQAAAEKQTILEQLETYVETLKNQFDDI